MKNKMIRNLFIVTATVVLLAISGTTAWELSSLSSSSTQKLDSLPVLRGAEPRGNRQILRDCPNHENISSTAIPQTFDGRKVWRACPSLWDVRDQGRCLSCWAVSIASMLTDRLCIATNGQENFRFSDEDILSCVADKAAWDLDPNVNGCLGGSVEKALKYLAGAKKGVVSGSYFNSFGGCRPTTILPVNQTEVAIQRSTGRRIDGDIPPTPKCNSFCDNENYRVTYKGDGRTVKDSCQFTYDPSWSQNELLHNQFVQRVQKEIMQNGPVVALMLLCKDFDTYDPKSENDIYVAERVKPGCSRFNHAVKIIGWGREESQKGFEDYWLIVNSYNYYWGRRGVFKIFRGRDRSYSAGINFFISAATPDITAPN